MSKLRIEALNRQRGREGDSKDEVILIIYLLDIEQKVYYKSYSFCR